MDRVRAKSQAPRTTVTTFVYPQESTDAVETTRRPILLRHPVQLEREEEGEAKAPCYAGAVSGWTDLIAGPKAVMRAYIAGRKGFRCLCLCNRRPFSRDIFTSDYDIP
jgi:hypothetical protein